jgi:hypothetical protein
MKHWGRLLRLSLAPTAAADAACGVLLGAGGWPAGVAPWLALVGSLCVYHGGMALNDWADRAEDLSTRPDRPIPSGAIQPGAALFLGNALLLVGPLLLGAVSLAAGLCLLAVALLAALYDTVGRGPLRGPLLLALCRAGNVGSAMLLGAAVSGAALEPLDWALPAVYGAYVFNLSRLGRLEDDPSREPGRAPVRALHLGSLWLLAAPIVVSRSGAELGLWLGLALSAAAIVGLQRAAAAHVGPWPRAQVTVAMGLLLRRLLVFTAAACLASGAEHGIWVAAAILAGYLVSHQLRRVFPPS